MGSKRATLDGLCVYTDGKEVELEGTGTALLAAAQAVDVGGDFELSSRGVRDPQGIWPSSLELLEIAVDDGLARVEPLAERLLITGTRDALHTLAENIRFVAAGPEQPTAVGYHTHIEPIPGDPQPWLATDSCPLIVTLRDS